jgi:hypothetical protein
MTLADAGPPVDTMGAPAGDVAAYLVQLTELVRGLLAAASGGQAAAIRLLRQRLVQWVEDLRSIGGHEDLASAVEAQAERLSAALASPATLVAEVTAVAAELAGLAAGAPPPPPKKKSRAAFWK